jgi:hypothetical protein
VGLQMLENKALSWGSIGKSAPILAEITIRKSQVMATLQHGLETLEHAAFVQQLQARRSTP